MIRMTPLRFEASFSDQEYERMSLGLIPASMDDKWFIFEEDNTLFFHRSWTDLCIYIVSMSRDGDLWRVREAQVRHVPW